MTRHASFSRALLLATTALLLHAETPLLYIPFDGSTSPAVGAARPSALANAGGVLAYSPGIRGNCVRADDDIRLSTGGLFPRETGTVAFWIRPHWKGTDTHPHSLFCLYGHAGLKEAWSTNRWSLSASSGQLHFTVYGRTPELRAAMSTSIATWEQAIWHHLAVTWTNVNSGEANAEVALFVDGAESARQTGLRLDAGPVAEVMDIGRDSDASPDYAEADLDEFYLYARPLTPAEIKDGVAGIRAPAPQRLVRTEGAWREDWWNDAWPYRCKAAIAADPAGHRNAAARLPFTVQQDLNALGLAGVLDPDSVRVVPVDPRTGACPRGALPLPAELDGDVLRWQPSGSVPAAARLTDVHVYFGVRDLDLHIPLLAQTRHWRWPQLPEHGLAAQPDYAAGAYGDAWDFDEGDTEGIDQWGNKPWCLSNQRVEGGILSFDVSEDPWFIWGNMWGQVASTNRPVAIDLDAYPVLEMKLRQSCPSATWELYGRPVGSDALMKHEFGVTGQGWQVIRVNLAEEARWGGVLQAFRIDPTAKVKEAHVDIDWIRLTREVEARRDCVEAYPPATQRPAALQLAIPKRTVPAGWRQAVWVAALDNEGKPVAGAPVTLTLQTTGGGGLESHDGHPSLALARSARRALTDKQGQAWADLVASRTTGEASDVLVATADFTGVRSGSIALDTTPGPPDHYRVSPVRATTVRERDLPLPLTVQLVDAFDNPLPVAGRRLTLHVPDGASLSHASATTDKDGRAQVLLTVDVTRRWVVYVEARDEQGCSGRSGTVSIALDTPRTNRIRLLPNGYFADAADRPFVPLGGFYANWVQKETADGEWSDLSAFTGTTEEEKRRWIEFVHQSGATALRFMLRTHHRGGTEGMDVGGRVNQWLFADALRYMDLAREFGLLFLLVVHDDYDKPVYVNEKHLTEFALPQFTHDDLDSLPPHQRRFVRDRKLAGAHDGKYTDPDVLTCQDQYAGELVSALRHNPQVFAYELENEMVACPAEWATRAADVIRKADPDALVCVSHGGGGLHTADPLWWFRNTGIDFYTYHLYPHGKRTSADMDYGIAVDVLTRYGRMCGPCFLGESAGDQFRLHPDVATRRWVMRDIIWLSLTNGNPGVFFWNARGPEIREFRTAREAMGALDLLSFRRLVPEIAIDVSHSLDDDKFFRSADGEEAYAMMGRYARHYMDRGIDFDFVCGKSNHAKRASLDSFTPPEPGTAPLRPTPGVQLTYLARADWGETLIYLRNFAGIGPWDSPMGSRGAWRQWLRARQPVPTRVHLALPRGTYDVRICDLDEEAVRAAKVDEDGCIDLGTTDHDFALILKRANGAP